MIKFIEEKKKGHGLSLTLIPLHYTFTILEITKIEKLGENVRIQSRIHFNHCTKSQSDRHETAGIMREGGGVINPHSIKGVQI